MRAAVIGAGIAGLTIARQLLEQGKRNKGTEIRGQAKYDSVRTHWRRWCSDEDHPDMNPVAVRGGWKFILCGD